METDGMVEVEPQLPNASSRTEAGGSDLASWDDIGAEVGAAVVVDVLAANPHESGQGPPAGVSPRPGSVADSIVRGEQDWELLTEPRAGVEVAAPPAGASGVIPLSAASPITRLRLVSGNA